MSAANKILFTPGPLTTSKTVKLVMQQDLGSRGEDFISVVKDTTSMLLQLAAVEENHYAAILLQGSGTFGVEAVLSSITPPHGTWLIIINGHYGHRLAEILAIYKIACITAEFAENQVPCRERIEEILQAHPDISHIAMVHCETTSGIVNDIDAIGALARTYQKIFFVDAMSSFGSIAIDFKKANIDFLVSSANKCLESVPGCCFIIAKINELNKIKGYARTLSLDLYAQWQNFLTSGAFRFTPPIQVILALQQALKELVEEGGIAQRFARYKANQQLLSRGMEELGFKAYLPKASQSCVITSFYYLKHRNFLFSQFYEKLYRRGFIIYPGKLSQENCFRIGSIGTIYSTEITALLEAARQVLVEMGVMYES